MTSISLFTLSSEMDDQSLALQAQVKELVKKWNIPEVNLPFFLHAMSQFQRSKSFAQEKSSTSSRGIHPFSLFPFGLSVTF
jgi:hypothetical protein